MPDSKDQIIQNIEQAVADQAFHRKVEVNDPVVDRKQIAQDIQNYLRLRQTSGYKVKTLMATKAADWAAPVINRRTDIIGLDKIKGLNQAGIITSNHFNPLENTAVRLAIHKAGYKKMAIVSQITNFEMTGMLGFFMKYSNTIPIADMYNYMGRDFPKLLKEQLDHGVPILIYPEQEMWLNYRKPRMPQRGAYYYAAMFNVPIISFFIEIIDLGKPERGSASFNQVRYRLHVLDPVFPNATLDVKHNSQAMMQTDYAQKKAAYEAAYHVPLDYTFAPSDIAGWRG
ncbi:1-acyl-sn-glycerol-3-phosphate acyltransferase [Lacticaseibacillus brantae]|uniref:1-acyl-sn-glycerol-3-phosphate acyltransferase n=1 Tax=Lacticaseibacillus brantae DSM 23927 TaxID=1423727 RepID=A0A0R2B2C5_9LACO|nr:1-acyl-sn-glycerol-3-phosphate acyltransferase [Lacticaseibacillus brantae]KRM72116.1 1-acyl-sn-glycerol-3-phosphate acyltransferase [Lacticaseibacillus brantae DSM 23927]